MTGQVDGKRNLSCTILLFRWLLRSGQKRYFWLYSSLCSFSLVAEFYIPLLTTHWRIDKPLVSGAVW